MPEGSIAVRHYQQSNEGACLPACVKLKEHQWISALEARRAADRAVFGDLVGCALSSGDPTWSDTPEPHWCVPYRCFDGTLLTVVKVDARTRAVSLTDVERAVLLEQIERLATTGNATT